MGKTIRILGTGGTIAGVGAPGAAENRYTAGELAIRELVEPLLPQLQGAVDDVDLIDVARIDSSNMTHAVWADLATAVRQALADPAVIGIVITHGTDTLEETAVFLEGVLRPSKPVVLTAAMRPASSTQADGPRHLIQAVHWACGAGHPGLWMAFGGQVWPAVRVRKLHPFALQAFGGGEAPPVAVWGESGWRPGPAPQGSVPPQALPDGGVQKGPVVDLPTDTSRWPIVDIIPSHAGASGRLIEAALWAGAQGLVVAATGNGSVHAELDAALARAVGSGRLAAADVLVASRCTAGWIVGQPAHRWPVAHRMTPAQARVHLMLDLAARGVCSGGASQGGG